MQPLGNYYWEHMYFGKFILGKIILGDFHGAQTLNLHNMVWGKCKLWESFSIKVFICGELHWRKNRTKSKKEDFLGGGMGKFQKYSPL